jgi:hypothetical protein
MNPKNTKLVAWIAAAVAVVVGAAFVVLADRYILQTTINNLSVKADKIDAVIEAFQNDKDLKGPGRQLVEKYHHQGISIATRILMITAENKGDLTLRDSLFIEGMRADDNSEARQLLGQQQLYRHSARVETLSIIGTIGGNGVLAGNLLRRATSTLSEAQQRNVEACRQLLDSRYSGAFSTFRGLVDIAFKTKSCAIKDA